LNSSFDATVEDRVYHLLNPYPCSYDEYLNAIRSAGLAFEVVSWADFVETIGHRTDSKNPLVSLSSFLEGNLAKRLNLEPSHFETKRTAERCAILRRCPRIDATLIRLYVEHWKKTMG
jgi:hypothetical protein